MKYFSLFSLCFLLALSIPATAQNTKNKVIILATGGTIAGSGESATHSEYKAGELPIEDLLEAVPEIRDYAEIEGEQIAHIGSQDMDIETWLKLSKRINEIFENNEADGIVITHGTDTMEETAYFLSLTVLSNNPVVLTGAMRPATAISQDGNRNLLNAVQVASSVKSKDKGTMVVMNENIYDARGVDKTHTTDVSSFQSKNFGPVGKVFNEEVNYYYTPIFKPQEKFDVREYENLPRVDIVYGAVDTEPQIVDFSVKNGALGIVYAGVGNGNFKKDTQKSLEKAVEYGLTVVRSSRTGEGSVTLNNEIDDDKYGFVVADDLSPQKARILLMLGLTQTNNSKDIQELFFSY